MTVTQKFDPWHSIPSVADLSQHAVSAYDGAKYHLERARQLAAEGREQYGRFDTKQFFWELASCYEIMLQWANREFDLGISEPKVNYKKVMQDTPNYRAADWPKIKRHLQEAYASDWHFALRAYRNFNIHRAFSCIQVVVRQPEPFDPDVPLEGGQLAFLQIGLAREGQSTGDIFALLDNYVDKMADLGQKLSPNTGGN